MKPRQVVAILGEFIVIALVASALSVTLRLVLSPKTWLDMVLPIVGNLIVVAAAGFYVANTREVWWVVALWTAVALGATQFLIPRLELVLPIHGDVQRATSRGLNGMVVGLAVAVGLALVFDLLDTRPRRPRFPGLIRNPASYFWRLPPLAVLHGVLQTGAMAAARSFLRTTRAGPSPADFLEAHLICGAVWVGVVALVLLGLRAPLVPTVLLAAGVVSVPGFVGRLVALREASPALLVTFLILTALADMLVLTVAALLLAPPLAAHRPRTAPAEPLEAEGELQPDVAAAPAAEPQPDVAAEVEAAPQSVTAPGTENPAVDPETEVVPRLTANPEAEAVPQPAVDPEVPSGTA